MCKLPVGPQTKKPSRRADWYIGFTIFLSVLISLVTTNGVAFAAAIPTAILNVPTEGFMGEPLNFTVAFDNTAVGTTETGYGPYIDLVLPATGKDGAGAATDDGITFVSATYLGQAVTATVLTFNASGQATHPYAKDALGNPVIVTGIAGDQLVVLQLPFGSFTQGQPAASLSIVANVSNLADVNAPLNIQARAGFQYGNDPLDNPTTDPTIIGTYATSPFTPTLFALTKTYIGPEDETATGPNFPRQYLVTVDIANGQTLTNLDLTDVLPNNLQFVQVDSTTIRGTTTATTAIATPSTTTPGGTLTRRFASVTGTTAGNDATMLFTFFVPLNNSLAAPVINATSGDDVTSINDASTQGNWVPIDTRDTSGAVSSNVTANDHTLTDKSIAIQKSVANVVDVNANGNSPGDTLEYTLVFQVSDFFAFQSLVITDTISDGQHWDNGFTPRMAVNGNQFTLAAAAMNAANFTVEPNYTPASPAPNDGTTGFTFRVSNELITRSQTGRMIGGCVPVAGTGGGVPNCTTYNDGGTTATITFRTIIQDAYSDLFPSGDSSLNQGDSLNNTTGVTGDLLTVANTNNLTGQSEADGSSAGITIAKGTLVKEVYAVNGVIGAPAIITSGDRVTYRIKYTLVLGDFENFTFQDYLPLPVFDVTDPDANGVPGPSWTFDNTGATTPPTGQWKRGPQDTQFARSGIIPTPATNGPANSLTFNYGTYDDPINTQSVIDLLFTVTATDKQFADKLFLTNQVRQSDQNTQSQVTTLDAIVQIQLTQPVLAMRKGVVATNRASGTTFVPTGALPTNVTVSAPGSGCPRIAGAGLPVRSSTLGTTFNSNLTGVDAADLVTFAIVVENTGSGLNGAFDVQLKDTLPTGFAVPGGGLNLCVTDGTGGVISTTNVGGGTGLLDQGIELIDPGATATPTGAIDPYNASSGRNIAIITFDLQLQTAVVPATNLVNTATLFNFTGQNAGVDHTTTDLTDTAQVTIAPPTIAKSITATNQAHTTSNNVAIGEIVTYSVTVTVPEGTTPTARITDTLVSGLAFVDCLSIIASPGLVSTQGAFSTICNAPTNPVITSSGRIAAYNFGTVTNSNTDNTTPETITVTYRVVVLNTTANVRGQLRNNQASWTWATSSSISASAPNVTIQEPTLQVRKSANPVLVDGGDVVTYTLVVSHTAASNTDAFNFVLSDPLPGGLTYVPGSAQFVSGLAPTAGPIEAGGTISASWNSFPVGSVSTLSVQGTISGAAAPSSTITNTATITWTSLPGTVTTAQSPYVTTSTERTGSTGDPGGAANNYTASGPVAIKISDVQPTKSLVATSESSTATPGTITSVNPALLAIGEIARYRLVVQIPESTAPNLQFQDQLPTGLTFLNDGTAKVAFVANETGFASTTITTTLPNCAGLNITGNSGAVTPTCPLPDSAVSTSATINNDVYISGTPIFFKFGNVTNTDSDADAEFIVVEFNAIADNTAAGSNDAGDNRNNTFSVFINGSQSGPVSNQLFTRIVEPSITNLDKTITVTPSDAGDTVTYQVTYSNASGANNTTAFDVRLLDSLPADLSLTLASVNINLSGGAATPTNNSAANTVDVTIATIQPGGSVTVTYSAILSNTVTSGQSITNTAGLIYSSLPGTGTTGNATGSNTPGASGAGNGERDGSGGAINDYTGSDPANFTIVNPTLSKSIVATSESSSSNTNLAVGEIVRYRLQVVLPEGTANAFKLIDTLPAGLSLIDNNQVKLSFVADTPMTTPGNVSGADNDAVPPSFVLPAARISNVGSVYTFDLGDLRNNDSDANQELVILEFNALVENISANNNGDVKNNTFKVQIAGVDRGSAASVNATIVEPSITNVDKNILVTPSDAGDRVTYQVTYSNTGTSTAFEVRLADILPADLTLITASVTVTPTGGAAGVTDASAANTVDVTIASVPVNGTVTLSYAAILNSSVAPLQVITNTANLTYTSLPATGSTGNPTGSNTPGASGASNGERNGAGGAVNDHNGSDNASITTAGYSITKVLDATSAAHTSVANVTIGEVITYALTITLPEGTTNGLGVLDNLPTGLAFVAGSVTVDTTGFNGTVPAPTPASSGGSGDDVTFTFGAISVAADNVTTNNSFIVRLQARVLNIPANVGVNPPGQSSLVNSATAQVGANPIQQTSTITATVVEPRMVIAKSLTPALAAAGDTVTITLVVSNTGTSDAFEVVIDDPLADAKFTAATAVTTPAGFAFSTVAAAPNTIVRYTGGSIPAGQNRTFVFTARLTSGVVKGEVLTNVATVTQATTLPGTDAGERDEPDVSANAPVTISAPDLTLAKTNNLASLVPGQTTVYSLTVTNVGNRAATGVVLTDTVPVSTTFDLAGSSSTWSCADKATAGTVCTFTVGTLGMGANQIVRFAVTVDLPLPSSITQIANTATTGDDGSHGPDPTSANNTAPDTDPIVMSSLGNYVWYDANYDGQQQGGEAPAVGVVVNLYNNNGVVIATTTTNASGIYTFTGLGPGDYTVGFVPPAGYALTTQTTGDAATDSNPSPTTGRTAPITLGVGENNTSIDAGLVDLVNLGDRIWLDTDGNGQQGAAGVEPGLAGVTVTLTYPNGTVITTLTDASGIYTFTDLLPNQSYTVTVTPPPGYNFTVPNSGSDASDSDISPTTGTVVVAMGLTDNLTIDAGLVQPMNLGSGVWFDSNGNSQQEPGEPGIPGAVVTLLLADGVTPATDLNGNPVTAQTTGPDGLYNFTNLPPGDYVVQVTMPPGYTPTPVQVADPNTDSSTDSNIASSAGNVHTSGIVSLTVGGEPAAGVDGDGTNGNLTVDFGFIGVNLGDFVWLDANYDGQQGAAGVEPGLAGVTVTLTYPNGTVISTNTDASGLYTFTNLIPNQTYTVTFTAPGGYAITTPNSGADATDSDADPATGVVVVNLGAADDTSIDAGLVDLVNLGDRIWLDTDGDGQQGAAGVEPGLAGVTVTLTYPNGTVITTLTDASGIYTFTNLLPNQSYTVTVIPPTGYIFTVPDSGSDTTDSDFSPTTGTVVVAMGLTDNLTVDAGLVQPIIITGGVYNDNTNGNGQKDGGEPGIAGVLITLSNGLTTTTDANGIYTFTLTIPGTYTITETNPAGYTSTGDTDGPNDDQIVVTVVGGQTSLDNDFLDAQANGSIAGTVCDGSTGSSSGLCEGGEAVLQAVTVTLVYAGPDGLLSTGDDNITQTVTTDVSGNYTFTALLPGVYQVTETNPPGYVSLADADGGDPDEISPLALAGGENLVDQDFEDNLVLTPASNYEVSKTLNGISPVRIGESLSFTIRITNTGDVTLTTVPLQDIYVHGEMVYLNATPTPNTAVADQLDWSDLTAGAPNGFGVDLAPGQSFVITTTFIAVRDTSANPGGVAVNTAVATGLFYDVDGPGGTPPQPVSDNPPVTATVGIVAPTAVSLADASVSYANGTGLLRWQTVNESDVLGFHVYRSEGSGQAVRLTDTMIAAQKPGQSDGAAYDYTDSSLKMGKLYTYSVEFVGADGTLGQRVIGTLVTGARLFLPRIGR